MNRRGFLASILAAGVAPAIVGSGILMPIRKLWTPDQQVGIDLAPYGDDCVIAISEVWMGNTRVQYWSPPRQMKHGETITVAANLLGADRYMRIISNVTLPSRPFVMVAKMES